MEHTEPTQQPMRPPEAWAKDPARQHAERFDVPVRGFVIFLIIFIAVAVILHIVLWFLFGLFTAPQPPVAHAAPGPLADVRIIPPAPQLQGSAIHPPAPAEDMQEMTRQQNQILGSYGWVDRPQGVARVPIDRAMALLLQGGLPAATQPSATPAHQQ